VLDSYLLQQLRDKQHIVIGIQQVKRGVLDGTLSHVVLAVDTDASYQLGIVRLCSMHNVDIVRVDNAKELGLLVGISVKTGCVGIVK